MARHRTYVEHVPRHRRAQMTLVLRRRVLLGTGVFDELVPQTSITDDHGVVSERHVSDDRLPIDPGSQRIAIAADVLDVMWVTVDFDPPAIGNALSTQHVSLIVVL